MKRIVSAGSFLAFALAFGVATNSATGAAPEWPHRQYWQWGDRPIWDDPWVVLRPNFWGSPEPHVVPADIWACKWHLPSARPSRWQRRQCPEWQ